MRVLVLGASGGIGSNIVRIAVEKGHAVTALTTSAFDAPADFPLAARIARVDVAWWMVENAAGDFAADRYPFITGGRQ